MIKHLTMKGQNERFDRINNYLTKEESELWGKYLDMKSKGVKKQANKFLTEFTEKRSAYPFEQNRGLVDEFLALSKEKVLVKDSDSKFEEERPKLELQHQLIERIVFPVLIDDFKQGRLGASRELSNFEFMFHHLVKFEEVLPEIPFPTDWRIGEFFLETELKNNSNDKEAAILLLNRKVRQLDHAIHELPEFGLLVEIEIFEEKLTDLKAFIQEFNLRQDLKDKIELYEFIQKTWKGYLENEKTYENYRQYLEENQIENREKIINA